jgi:hypothetical protein
VKTDDKPITSAYEFIGRIGLRRIPKGADVLFRGQPEEGNLIPKIARPDPARDTSTTEMEMMDDLQRRGRLHKELQTNDQWVLLSVAQHFGMTTRLLDWTSNPLAALWFACREPDKNTEYSYVYLLWPKEDWILKVEDTLNPFDNARSTKVLKPALTNRRILAQNGWFTAHVYSNNNKRWVALEKNTRISPRLFEFRIKSSRSHEILGQLNTLGINYESLFPDIEGTCRFISWLHT